MQFPESWLREFCDPPLSSAELAETLTMAGLEVEARRPVAPPFTGVVAALVLSVEQHPNADRLKVCRVDVGSGAPLTVVCGAPNVEPGIMVPCALVGAALPAAEEGAPPFVIKLGKLRGVESQGMLCSARELRLSSDDSGLLVLASDAPIGGDLRAHLGLDDMLFSLKLTPNLAHCLSVFGVARELAALTGAELKRPRLAPIAVTEDARLPVRIDAPDLCGRFSGRVVRGVNARALTPEWMIRRLERCGQRSIGPLIDISNYVMFESGQASHVFDLDKLRGGLEVRWGRPGESLELLNGSRVEVDQDVGVIADGEGLESLAGIMGGQATAVDLATRNVYIEAAFWRPEAIAGRARRFRLATEASHRFERGVDPARTVEHVERLTELVLQICGGQAGPIDDHVGLLPSRLPVSLRVARAARVIGMPVTQAQCAEAFRRLRFEFVEGEGTIAVTPPSWRFDLQGEEDLIEEVIRILGYSRLPDVAPVSTVEPRLPPKRQQAINRLQDTLVGLDYQETINFSFVEERWELELCGNADPIRLLNPIAAPLAVMRSSLMGSLLGVLRVNIARKAARVRVFEMGRVFRRNAAATDNDRSVAGIDEVRRIAGLAYGPLDGLQWATPERAVDFFDCKGDVEALLEPLIARFVAAEHPAFHPGRSARIEIDGRVVGWLGELHPKWRQSYDLPKAPILFELDVDSLTEAALPLYLPTPKRQAVQRDVALVIGEHVTFEALRSALLAAAKGSIVRGATLFDVYRPASTAADRTSAERSMAVRLEMFDDESTLTDERIEAAVGALIDRLIAERVVLRLRG